MSAGSRREPRWAGALRRVDAGVAVLGRAYGVFRDELLFAIVPPDQRDAMTAAAYTSVPEKYAPGRALFDLGLYDWERAALADMRLPPGAKVLLGGAGGGRELPELARAGYQVVAFEPAPSLCRVAKEVAASYPGFRVIEAGYSDYADAVREGRGPLVGATGPFDAVMLGWGSFNHVTIRDEQVRVLSAIRESSPRAPALLSFASRASAADIGGDDRLRRPLRNILERATGRKVESGLRFQTRCAFLYRYTREELADIVTQAGYRVLRLEWCAYQHGLRSPAYGLLAPAGK